MSDTDRSILQTPKHLHQDGIVSIMVTVIMMLVISLIVLGLGQASRREQRQAIDNQLSAQAFYAAESGVNDAIMALKDDAVGTKDTCDNTDGGYDFDVNLTTDGSVSYPCLLIDSSPTTLRQDLSTTSPAVFILHPTSGNLDTVTLKWGKASSAGGPVSSCPSTNETTKNQQIYSPANEWKCPYGVLRVDLVSAKDVSRDDLLTKTRTIFISPSSSDNGSGDLSFGSAKTGGKYAASSCVSAKCQFKITDLNYTTYYMRVSSVYQVGKLTITSPGNQFKGDQVEIDATGKAQDILRRILVSVDLKGKASSGAGDALLSGDTLCKRFETYTGYYKDDCSSP